MNDVRTRINTEAGTIDRRKLLKIGAWAAPALLVATAVPTAAATQGDDNPAPPPDSSTLSKPTVVPSTPQVGSAPNEVKLWHASIFYDYNQWGLTGQNSQTDGPQSLTVTFRVRLTTTAGAFVADVIPQETVTIAKYGTVERSGTLPGVAAGNYLVVSEIISNVFTPATVNDVTFSAPIASASAPVTVKNTW